MKVRDDFASMLLESKRDFARAQLSCAQRNFESERGCLNADLLGCTRELDSTLEELARSQECNCRLVKELALAMEKDCLASLDLFEV